MEISEIKQKLSLSAVLQYYGLEPDKNQRLHCPFHNDKTPSLQVYLQTHTVYCFSSNCKTHGKSLDVIDFIMYKESCTKYEALKKAATFLTDTGKLDLTGQSPVIKQDNAGKGQESRIRPSDDRERIIFLTKLFHSFKLGLERSKPALEYIRERKLDRKQIEMGYNGGSFHHGEKKDAILIRRCLEYGLLLDKDLIGHKGEKIYSVFGKNGLVFPLRNPDNEIVSLYFRSIVHDKSQRHFYLKQRQGLYPGYPDAGTKKLILTESVIDAASLVADRKIRSQYGILSLYGTNGLTAEHREALKGLSSLEEIIFFLNGDVAGIKATGKYAGMFQAEYPALKLTAVAVPRNEDINSLLQGHTAKILLHLIETRKETGLLLSTEKEATASTAHNPAGLRTSVESNPSCEQSKEVTGTNPQMHESFHVHLNTSHPDCLLYQFKDLCFTLWGGIDIYQVNRLRATLHIRLAENTYRSFRDTVDLYSHTQTERLVRQASERLEISPGLLADGITGLTSELEQYRDSKREEKRREEHTQEKTNKDIFSQEHMQASLELLKNKELNRVTHDIFGNLGLIGQQDHGMLLFFIFLTRLFKNPLHAIVMGSSGSGKTHLLQGVAQTIPKQHIHYTTSLSENTLYYTPKDFLRHKILLQEDLDGAYNALLPLRELMSNQSISRFSTKTNSRTGDSKQVYLQVEGPVCIAGATTKERIYEDNANRSFLIQIEDYPAQERAVLEYQGKVASGEINPKSYEKNINLLKAAQLQLEALEVLIPFASGLDLPPFVFKKLRTKSHYLTLIKSVTLWNQKNRQRRTDEAGNPFLLSTVEDVKWANYLCKKSLLRKSDELPGKTRNFFESLKSAQTKGKEQIPLFRSVAIRQQFRLHPMQAKRYLDELEARGLIRCKTRSQRFGNEYEIVVWDDYQTLQSGLDVLDETIRKLEASQGITRVSQTGM